jgi:hypothetical protein
MFMVSPSFGTVGWFGPGEACVGHPEVLKALSIWRSFDCPFVAQPRATKASFGMGDE